MVQITNVFPINIIDIYNYFISNSYNYSDAKNNYNSYISTFIVNTLKENNNNDINYDIIQSIVSQIIIEKNNFFNLFKPISDYPCYIYNDFFQQTIINKYTC